jgi:hypothetical protein
MARVTASYKSRDFLERRVGQTPLDGASAWPIIRARSSASWASAGSCKTGGVDASAVVLIVVLAVPLVIVGVMFVWAAIRDGEEDRAVQRRLGIRRKTRLGR